MKYSKYPFYISQLIIKSLKGQLTEAEQEELDRWLTIEANRVLYLSLSRRNLDDKKNLYGQLHPERTWERLEKRLYLDPTLDWRESVSVDWIFHNISPAYKKTHVP